MRALVLVVVVLGSLFTASGCSTVIKPTRPSTALVAGEMLRGLRFDGEEVKLREPGMPLAPSRAWQREVENYTARALNTVLATDETAPTAQTIVTFDLGSPSVIQIGTWKEMTISLTSTLPDGSVIKSEPVAGDIDDGVEYALVTGMGVGGTVLDVVAAVSSIFFVFQPSLVTGGVFVGALLGGLVLNLGQSGAQYLVAASEETRWSDLYARALRQHALDIREGIGRGPPPKTAPPEGATTTPKKLGPAANVGDPPPLLDPADPR